MRVGSGASGQFNVFPSDYARSHYLSLLRSPTSRRATECRHLGAARVQPAHKHNIDAPHTPRAAAP